VKKIFPEDFAHQAAASNVLCGSNKFGASVGQRASTVAAAARLTAMRRNMT
jgi:hypothetical protein